MKRRFVFCLGAMLFAGTLAAQTPVPEWQAGVDKVKSLIKTNPEQASDAAGELLKGKNKKNVELVTSVARAYLDVGQLKEAETYLEMARKADNKAPAVSVLEGDIAFARKDIGKACQLYEQAIYFDSNYKDAYLKYAQAYKSASPSQAIEKLNQLKAIAPDCLEADKELAEVYYATNRFGKAADTYAKFIDTPVATEDDILKYAFALFLNHDFEKSLAVAQKGLQKNARHAAFNRLVMYNNVDLKRYDEAEKAADAFFNASDNADYSCLDYRYHGALLSALKKYDQAIEEYGKALEKDESQVDLWREIADAYELKNDYTQAIAAYKKYYDSLATTKHTPETDSTPNSNCSLTVAASIANICSPNGFTSGSEAAFGNLKENPLPERFLFKSSAVVSLEALSILATLEEEDISYAKGLFPSLITPSANVNQQ